MLRRFILIGALVLVAGTQLAAAITRVQTAAAPWKPCRVAWKARCGSGGNRAGALVCWPCWRNWKICKSS